MTIVRTAKEMQEYLFYLAAVDYTSENAMQNDTPPEVAAVKALERYSRQALREVDLVIASWCDELDIERNWPDTLHPADVLDKYVFPALREAINDLKDDMLNAYEQMDLMRD